MACLWVSDQYTMSLNTATEKGLEVSVNCRSFTQERGGRGRGKKKKKH